MNDIISAYIDDELNLEEKITLIQKAGRNPAFAAETIAFLHQEKRVRAAGVGRLLDTAPKPEKRRVTLSMRFLRPVGVAATALATLVILLFAGLSSDRDPTQLNRFVIYRPDVGRAEIAGSFTDWQRVPLHRLGNSGYWEIRLAVPKGEHRYTYILEGRESFADPTVSQQEFDGFGGRNSILVIGENA